MAHGTGGLCTTRACAAQEGADGAVVHDTLSGYFTLGPRAAGDLSFDCVPNDGEGDEGFARTSSSSSARFRLTFIFNVHVPLHPAVVRRTIPRPSHANRTP